MNLLPMLSVSTAFFLAIGSQGFASDAPAATPLPTANSVEWLEDYKAAYVLAEEASRPLLIWFRDQAQAQTKTALTAADDVWADAEVTRRLERFVPLRIAASTSIDEASSGKPVVLLQHPAFAELRGQPGIAIVDLADSASSHYRDVVSIYPVGSGKSILRRDLLALLDLPAGSLTQRTLIFAVRTHPESPQSTSGNLLPLLATEAEKQSDHQASITLQGHHFWEHRFHRLNDQLPDLLIAQEVCAESWPGQGLFEAARECVHSWRQSSGHWSAVQRAQPVYGYDIKRGRNGVWYATGVFGTQRE